MVFPLCRFKCRGRNTSAERKRLPQSELLRHEGSVFSSLAGFNGQHPAFCGPPSALLPATTPLGCRGRSLHRHLLPESRWEAKYSPTCKQKFIAIFLLPFTHLTPHEATWSTFTGPISSEQFNFKSPVTRNHVQCLKAINWAQYGHAWFSSFDISLVTPV